MMAGAIRKHLGPLGLLDPLDQLIAGRFSLEEVIRAIQDFRPVNWFSYRRSEYVHKCKPLNAVLPIITQIQNESWGLRLDEDIQ